MDVPEQIYLDECLGSILERDLVLRRFRAKPASPGHTFGVAGERQACSLLLLSEDAGRPLFAILTSYPYRLPPPLDTTTDDLSTLHRHCRLTAISTPSNGSAGGSRKRVKYTEQHFAQIDTAMANRQTQSALFRLPGKVRAKIFDLSLSTTTAQSIDIRVALHHAEHHGTSNTHRDIFAPPSTALLRTW